MRIDLHIHTKKNNKGESNKINIDSEKFKKKLKDAGVGIAAITNHYKFDKEQYYEFCDSDFLLLPGVELDILIENKRVQANVIASPNDIDMFCEILNEIDNEKAPIKYEDFIKKFNIKKWIISLDYKNSTAWDEKYMRDVIKRMDKAFVIADVNNSETLMVLNANNFNALLGSDIKNWDDYESKSKKLVKTKFIIDDYDNFWLILKNETTNIKNLFKNFNYKVISKIKTYEDNDKKYEISNLEIIEGVNIIFGPKRTGKTKILESLDDQLKNSVLYSSSDKEVDIDKIKKELKSENYFIDEKEAFKKEFYEILEYKENIHFNFHSFYKYIGKKSIIKLNNWEIKKIIDPNIDKKNNFSELTLKISKKIRDTKNMFEENEICNYDNWKEESDIILKLFWDKWKDFNKEWLIYKLKTKIKTKLSKLIKQDRGIYSRPNEINIIERYENKQKLLNLFESIKEKKCVIEKYIRDFEIPGREENKAYQIINFVDFYNDTSRDFFKKKQFFDKIVKNIAKLKIEDDFQKLISELNEWNKNNNYLIWNERVVIKDKHNNSDFSNGEKSHLLLKYYLSDEKKEYFLLDEPDAFLSKESIIDFLIPKISDLAEKRKTILITTHNSSIGINTIPVNYIYRKYSNGKDECQTYIGSIWQKEFINMTDKNDKLEFKNEIIGAFEGSEKHFNFRKGIYETNKI